VYDPRMRVALARRALACLALSACARAAPAEGPPLPPTQPAPAAAASAAPHAPPASAAPSGEPRSVPPRSCGAFDCLAFATPRAAFEFVLGSQPRVLAIGEAHAQQGTTGIRSSTRRFAEQLLPALSGRSKHIVIELLVANCKAPTVSGVSKAQAPVTEHQAQSNQSEFLTLGKYAQRLGIEPQALAPSCSEYDSVIAAGDDGVSRLLTMVADQTNQAVSALLAGPDAPGDVILTYGGALHNDLHPRPGQETWSFGPQLSAATQGRYVELDLIVPEFVKDSEAWRNLPWFAAFDREHLSHETFLYQSSARSFALIFPKTDAAPGL